ncbi:ABC transporter ATP-binding protein [Paenibacillus sp. R14(2021)]|uniref:ABC transporter ATP-binding protein n=1 Tax=Paenibacillus sp. R14(2021) TaxID=2859228 RepID=UPI001C615503|nr:ATP-binding cassette domain-containing protein [Paenibacillus sp. R14(2021)]
MASALPARPLIGELNELAAVEEKESREGHFPQPAPAFSEDESGKPFGAQVGLGRVSFSFGEKPIIRQLSAEIGEGEFVSIVGRSGSGKSTLLRLIAGLEEPGSGSIALDGVPSAGLRPDVRVMFQEARLLPWKSVLDNVRIGAPGGDRAKSEEALGLVGLASFAKSWPSDLSGGQRQRVALARALAGSPRLLLLDEPLGALDALTRIEMQQLIERLWRERRFTAVLVTHDVSEAVALGDRVMLVEDGAISLDVSVSLPRPRERDQSFAYYERHILDRVMTKSAEERHAGIGQGYII